jgi:hypothetical protein
VDSVRNGVRHPSQRFDPGESTRGEKFEVCNIVRLLCTAVVALALLQNSGCSDGAERRDGALHPNGDSPPDASNLVRAGATRRDQPMPGDVEIPVVRAERPSRKADSSLRAAADSNLDMGTSIPSAADAPDAREAPRFGEDPRLEATLDPEASAERVYQIESLDAEGDDLGTLLDVLASDPDPAVRVAAADLLAESNRGEEAIDGLLLALGDPSREVVLQALETLALVGEKEIVPSVEPLLDHSDAEIRKAAEDTLYFVDDSDPDELGSGSGTKFGVDSNY